MFILDCRGSLVQKIKPAESLKLLIRFPWNVKQSELSLIRFFFTAADSIRKERKVFLVYMVYDETCFYICPCVVSVHSCEMQTHAQIQSQGNETFFISCVCIYVARVNQA